jgi:hypothetical protein
MSYRDDWMSLSSRIGGLKQAGELHARFLAVRASDGYGRSALLREQCEAVLAALEAFRTQHDAFLPNAVKTSIDGFVAARGPLIRDTSGGSDSREERVWTALVMLSAFEAEVTFLLSDTQQTLRSRADRAFEHLQRLIVVDVDVAAKWQAAFERGEEACEQLGALHLLLHGVWAFKANAAGERTDLVYQEPIRDLSVAERTAEGLVLTEWKKYSDSDEPDRRFEDARRQANRYAQGALAGFELTAYRYAVVVSKQHIAVPPDQSATDVTYRHVNIAVEPKPPSRVARRKAAT